MKHIASGDSPNHTAVLNFADSHSKKVGASSGLKGYLQDNALSIVGVMQMAGASVQLFDRSPVIKAIGASGVISRGFMAVYGNKAHQRELAQSKNDNAPKLGHSVTDNIRKTFHPSAYPLEFGAATSILANAASIGYGAAIEQKFAKSVTGLDQTGKALSRGRTLIGVGAASMLAFAYLLFTEEKIHKKEDDQSLNFAASQSKPKSWLGEQMQTLKDQPVLASSIVNGALTAVMAVGNWMDGQKTVALAGAVFFASHVTKAVFVQKEEFNIDGAREDLNNERQRQEKVQDKILAKQPAEHFTARELDKSPPAEQMIR